MKKTMIKRTLRMGCVVALLCLLGLISAFAGGPPLKENACGVCHQDYSKIMPPKHPDVGKVTACMTCHKTDPAKTDSTKFSESVHKAHQGGKTKLDCGACHAL